MKRMRSVLILLLIMATAGALMAQAPFTEERREQLESLRIWKMTEFMKLSPEQSTLFFPKLRAFEESLREDQDQQRVLMRKVHSRLENPQEEFTQAEVDQLIRDLMKMEKQILDKRQTFMHSLENDLSPDQQARFIIFESQFKHRLMRMMHSPQNGGPAPRNRRRQP